MTWSEALEQTRSLPLVLLSEVEQAVLGRHVHLTDRKHEPGVISGS